MARVCLTYVCDGPLVVLLTLLFRRPVVSSGITVLCHCPYLNQCASSGRFYYLFFVSPPGGAPVFVPIANAMIFHCGRPQGHQQAGQAGLLVPLCAFLLQMQ